MAFLTGLDAFHTHLEEFPQCPRLRCTPGFHDAYTDILTTKIPPMFAIVTIFMSRVLILGNLYIVVCLDKQNRMRRNLLNAVTHYSRYYHVYIQRRKPRVD
jgi:hypothetical protein